MDPRQNAYGSQPSQLQPPTQAQHQRFSWQPPQEEEAPPYEPPQQHSSQTANLRDQTLSYAQTPLEHRDPYYASSTSHPPLPQSPSTPIDLRPQSFYTSYNVPAQPPQQMYQEQSDTKEKTPFPPVTPQPTQHQPPFSPDSYQRQLPRTDTSPQNNHARKRSNLSPLQTNLSPQNMPPVPHIPSAHKPEAEPLPYKTPISPISSGPITKSGLSPLDTRKSAAEPYTPHGFPTSPAHAVFSPHAAHGPNGLDAALHQPGQISHPNMDLGDNGTSKEWKHSLCECSGDCETCMTGLFCPSILYGRTSYRLAQKSEKKDPTDLLGYSAANGHCGLMSIACGLWGLFPMIQRTRVRHLYKVTGSLGSDILKGCCCCCCVAIQNEREVRDREESARRWAGPASTQVYTAPAQMAYKPQG